MIIKAQPIINIEVHPVLWPLGYVREASHTSGFSNNESAEIVWFFVENKYSWFLGAKEE